MNKPNRSEVWVLDEALWIWRDFLFYEKHAISFEQKIEAAKRHGLIVEEYLEAYQNDL